MSAITFARPFEPALCFHVLSHLDLGADAANLYDATLPTEPWVEGLASAYAAAPGRLTLHAVALSAGPQLGSTLRDAPPPALSDPAGRELLRRFAAALHAVRESYRTAFDAAGPGARNLKRERATALGGPLKRLRAALYEVHGEPPPLRILDCPALGPCGRAIAEERGRIVAVSLEQDVEHLLCQILHEEVHAVTDPAVRSGGDAPQDTRRGTPGYALHEALETAAIEVGAALIEARAPAWAPAYARWRARFGA